MHTITNNTGKHKARSEQSEVPNLEQVRQSDWHNSAVSS